MRFYGNKIGIIVSRQLINFLRCILTGIIKVYNQVRIQYEIRSCLLVVQTEGYQLFRGFKRTRGPGFPATGKKNAMGTEYVKADLCF